MSDETRLGPIWPCLTVAAIAIAAGMPLFVRDLSALAGTRFDPCEPVFGTTCPPFEEPAEHLVAGVPLSGLGMTYSVTLVLELLLGAWLGPTVGRSMRYLLFFLAVPAALLAVYLLFLLISGLAHGCPYCFVGNVCSLLQVGALCRAAGGSWKTIPGRLLAWNRRVLFGRAETEVDVDRLRLERLSVVAANLVFVATFVVIRALTLSNQLAGLNG